MFRRRVQTSTPEITATGTVFGDNSSDEGNAPSLFDDVYRLVHEEKNDKQFPIRRVLNFFEVDTRIYNTIS